MQRRSRHSHRGRSRHSHRGRSRPRRFPRRGGRRHPPLQTRRRCRPPAGAASSPAPRPRSRRHTPPAVRSARYFPSGYRPAADIPDARGQKSPHTPRPRRRISAKNPGCTPAHPGFHRKPDFPQRPRRLGSPQRLGRSGFPLRPGWPGFPQRLGRSGPLRPQEPPAPPPPPGGSAAPAGHRFSARCSASGRRTSPLRWPGRPLPLRRSFPLRRRRRRHSPRPGSQGRFLSLRPPTAPGRPLRRHPSGRPTAHETGGGSPPAAAAADTPHPTARPA